MKRLICFLYDEFEERHAVAREGFCVSSVSGPREVIVVFCSFRNWYHARRL